MANSAALEVAGALLLTLLRDSQKARAEVQRILELRLMLPEGFEIADWFVTKRGDAVLLVTGEAVAEDGASVAPRYERSGMEPHDYRYAGMDYQDDYGVFRREAARG